MRARYYILMLSIIRVSNIVNRLDSMCRAHNITYTRKSHKTYIAGAWETFFFFIYVKPLRYIQECTKNNHQTHRIAPTVLNSMRY